MTNDSIDLEKSDFEENRYSRFSLIPWWDQDKLTHAKILVVGAGALGNEIIKNLALLGVGEIIVIDMDKIEHSNLTRSVLFRAGEVGCYKADVAAKSAMEINPDVNAISLVKNVIDDVGLGVFKYVDMVLGGLDNREARLFVNQCCFKVGKPYIDGAIEVLNGFARVFLPPDGPCYECTMTENDWRLLSKRKSCAMLSHQQLLEGKIPTTPTSSSIIAGIEVQEMLKLLHSDRNLPTLAGKCYVFNGLTHDSYIVEYQRKPGCMSHDTYENICETEWSAQSVTLGHILQDVRSDMGADAEVLFDREIATTAQCAYGHIKRLFTPVRKLTRPDLLCPDCGKDMSFDMTHFLCGKEDFLDMTAAQIGIPPGHIIAGKRKYEMKYYEFTKDIPSILGKHLVTC